MAVGLAGVKGTGLTSLRRDVGGFRARVPATMHQELCFKILAPTTCSDSDLLGISYGSYSDSSVQGVPHAVVISISDAPTLGNSQVSGAAVLMQHARRPCEVAKRLIRRLPQMRSQRAEFVPPLNSPPWAP